MPVKSEIFAESSPPFDFVEDKSVEIIEEPLDATDIIKGIEALLFKSRSPQVTEESAIWEDAAGVYIDKAASLYPRFTHYQTQLLFAVHENESPAESFQLFKMFEQSIMPEQKEKVDLLIKDSDGDVEKMIMGANLLLVVKKAKEFAGVMFLEQAIEFGNEGLAKSIKKYDRNRGVAFSTYATKCITDYILGATDDESDNIYIPRGTLRGARRAEAIAEHYKEKSGKYITDEELFAALKAQYSQDTENSRVHLMVNAYRDNVMHVRSLFESAYSSGSRVSSEGRDNKSIIDIFPGDEPNPETIVIEQEERVERIKGALEIMYGKGVTKDEARVMLYRCGLLTGYTMTLDEVAEILGRARSTLQKWESNFFKKMGLSKGEIGLDFSSISKSKRRRKG